MISCFSPTQKSLQLTEVDHLSTAASEAVACYGPCRGHHEALNLNQHGALYDVRQPERSLSSNLWWKNNCQEVSYCQGAHHFSPAFAPFRQDYC